MYPEAIVLGGQVVTMFQQRLELDPLLFALPRKELGHGFPSELEG
jgi:hypothetical protein